MTPAVDLTARPVGCSGGGADDSGMGPLPISVLVAGLPGLIFYLLLVYQPALL